MILFNSSLLFVHNPKTAGTSLIRFFETSLRPPVFKAGVSEMGTHHPHLSQAEGYAAAVLGRRAPDFEYIVAVARDPFERERSMYQYFREVLAKSPTLRSDLPDPLMLEAVEAAARLDFSEFVGWTVAERQGCDLWRSRGYYEREGGGHPPRLTLLRCEALEDELHEYLPDHLFVARAAVPRLNATSETAGIEMTGEAAATIAASYPWLLEPGYGASELRPEGIPAYPRHPAAPD